MHYLDHTDIERYLNITLEENGVEYVDSLIPAVEDYIDSATNRTWKVLDDEGEPIEFTETFDGNASLFFPRNIPIDEVISFTVDGEELPENQVYAYDSLIRTEYLTARGRRNVIVTYTSRATVPEDLKLALIKWIAQSLEGQGVKDEEGKTLKRARIGQVEMEYVNVVTKDVPDFVSSVIERYRLPVV
jgi:hypothetical protein